MQIHDCLGFPEPGNVVGCGFIRVLGSVQPAKFNMRVRADVPLRCTPATRIAAFFVAAGDSLGVICLRLRASPLSG